CRGAPGLSRACPFEAKGRLPGGLQKQNKPLSRPSRSSGFYPAEKTSPANMQHADEGEQAAGGVEIDIKLVGDALLQHFGGLVVDAAPPHVDGFDLAGGGVANRLIVAVADGEV